MDKYEWEVGMKVLIKGIGSIGDGRIATIERLTKTQVVLKDNTSRYQRKGGRQIGASGYHYTFIHPVTDDDIARIEKHERAYRVYTMCQKMYLQHLRELDDKVLDNLEKVLSDALGDEQ